MYIKTEPLGLNGVECTVELSIRKEFDRHVFFIDNPTKKLPCTKHMCSRVRVAPPLICLYLLVPPNQLMVHLAAILSCFIRLYR